MKKVITSIIQQILCAAVVTFCLPSLVLAQQQDRVVDWQPVVIKSETNVLEIVDIKIAGKSITIGRSFTADDNWLNALTFRVRNVSGKTIKHFGFGVTFPELRTDANPGTLGFSVTYLADESLHAPAANAQKRPLMADEEADLKMPEDQLAIMKHISQRLRGTPTLSKLNITLGLVNFEDGSGMSRISFRREAREKN
jgi:hypothetical protein